VLSWNSTAAKTRRGIEETGRFGASVPWLREGITRQAEPVGIANSLEAEAFSPWHPSCY
jgi:hypothetical protein